ncbi:PR5-like receptor kinase [Triticum aestivum]|uniref:PR5-like receptor kinase n=1 Tax=Triticum aestivum TaxID=4565 RepID=UPI000843377A|nr:PR5-like receptor kinase [Triticum aestivum]
MAAVSASPALHSLPFLLLLLVAAGEATMLNITNRCSYTVWPAAMPVGGGVQLDPGATWTLNVSGLASHGRVWARTGCSFNGRGNGSCQTGDCGGMLACKAYGRPPNTMAEFTIGQFNNTDFFDLSFVDSFNVPMDFLPVQDQGGPGCGKGPRCAANITSQCPSELTAPGGCNNACTVFKQDRYCCTGNAAYNCEPTKYSLLFQQICPDVYDYSMDADWKKTFTCPLGTNYQIVFCPSINLNTSLPSTGSSSSSKRRIGLILGTVVGFILIAGFLLFFVHRRRTRRHREMEEEEEEFGKLQGTPMRFTFHQLEVATEQFRDKLGEGGFGSVFEGQLGGERIAVKRLDQAGQGKKEFSAEVQTIGSIHHINLVKLIGFCVEKSHRLLVYEYMPKGSLDRWIYCHDDNIDPPLDWSTRCKIITHIAKGLSYLHEECTKRIAHLDVKPQNILLDDNFNAKLSDFGLCKLIDRDMSQVVTRMRGTPGYLAPEWLTSQITEKADVYSFGIVVIEIINGRQNLDPSRSEESMHLITLLEKKVKHDNLVDMIDKTSKDMQAHEQDVIQMMMLAMWCLQIDCKRRPKMSEVVKVLEGTMNAESNIDHNFVATNQVNFRIADNAASSVPPLASHVSGPR